MSRGTLPPGTRPELCLHYQFKRIPFRKNVPANLMFDSDNQRVLREGLQLWTQLRGLGLVTGPSGVGKSISVRRFLEDLPSDTFAIHRFSQIPTTPTGFLRALNRRFQLAPRLHAQDMFDQLQCRLEGYQEAEKRHPLLILDDVEGMRAGTIDLIRRLVSTNLDEVDHISVLLIGTPLFLDALAEPRMIPLRNRFAFAHTLQHFGLRDTKRYIAFHLDYAGGDSGLFTEDAVRLIFTLSEGVARLINQLCIQALIHALVFADQVIDREVIQKVAKLHPFFSLRRGS